MQADQAAPKPTQAQTPDESSSSPPAQPDDTTTPASQSTLPHRPSANRSGPRSRQGCWTCREKKVKCDEGRPVCQRCIRLRRQCDYRPRPRKPYTRKASSVRTPSSSSGRAETPSQGAASPSSSSTSSGSSDRDPQSPPDYARPPIPSSAAQIIARRASRHDSLATLASGLQQPEMAAACSVVFTPADHEAIYYYRTRFSTNHHTKNPEYSVFSLLFLQAQRHAMPMHMILALADQELMWLRSIQQDLVPAANRPNSQKSVSHYTEALHLMTQQMRPENGELDIDQVLAALWLMIAYEQKYGDGGGIGLSKHLQGAASILRTRFQPLLQVSAADKDLSQAMDVDIDSTSQAVVAAPAASSPPANQALISFFAARMMVWMAVLDAGAAFGIGSNFGGSVNKLVRQIAGEEKGKLLRGFNAIHEYSEPLFRTTWGERYPQAELVDDMDNRKVYSLYAKAALIRYENAEFSAALHRGDDQEAARRAIDIEGAFCMLRDEFAELLDLASRLSPDVDHSRRLYQNIRYVVPHYYAMELEFLRLTRFAEPLAAPSPMQKRALHEIMNLAYQGYKHEGERFLQRIPLPLLFAGMETDDLIHRAWILDRYQGLTKYGKNYARAFDCLKAVVEEQDKAGGRRVDHMLLLAEGRFEQFVI
ncbi:putative transcriptional regulatory protein C15D4.02 [Lasiodiplodia hormozganensis]|uniref:Transcriptional regulatory protein C15D4.02 n=1 Tax=Lasiodiplodia hormozganensis TaxID=869390 RepID=A0AA40CJ79_9PEZI|nr:putative transcriptional regulatory protein C15D4.02 [Lasiodiplodia hormozganensis]